jgi:hypothetical protein
MGQGLVIARVVAGVLLFAAVLGAGGCYSIGFDPGAIAGTRAGLPTPRSQNPSVAGDIPAPVPVDSADGAIGESCRRDDPGRVCLAIKYVAFRDSVEKPTVTLDQAISNVKNINELWEQCNLGFQIESYFAVDPDKMGLKYALSNYSDLDKVREAFGEDNSLLVVTTGAWDRSGSLGSSSANAWTSLPDSGPFGAVLEKPVATYSNIIAHELGHYLNLLHTSDTNQLMNPVIYQRSRGIAERECSTARNTARSYWKRMLR